MKKFSKEQLSEFVTGLTTGVYTEQSLEVATVFQEAADSEQLVLMSEEEVAAMSETLVELEARVAFIRNNTITVSEDAVSALVTEGLLEDGVGKLVDEGFAEAGSSALKGAKRGAIAGAPFMVVGAIPGAINGAYLGAIIGLLGLDDQSKINKAKESLEKVKVAELSPEQKEALLARIEKVIRRCDNEAGAFTSSESDADNAKEVKALAQKVKNLVLSSKQPKSEAVEEDAIVNEGVGKVVASGAKASLKATVGTTVAGAGAGATVGLATGVGAAPLAVAGGAVGAVSGLVGTLAGMIINYFGARKLKRTLADDEQVTKALAGIKAQHAKITEWSPRAQKGIKSDMNRAKQAIEDLIDGEEDQKIVSNGRKVISALDGLYNKTESVELSMTEAEEEALYETLVDELLAEGAVPGDVVQAPQDFSGSELAGFMTRSWNGTNNDKMIEEFRSQLKGVKTAEDRAALLARLDGMVKEAETVKADPSGFLKAVNAKMLVAGNVSDDTIMSTSGDVDGMTAADLKAYCAGLEQFRDRVMGMKVPAAKAGKDS